MPFFLIFTILLVGALLLARTPTQEDAKAARLGDFNFPRVDEGTPKPLVYGTMRINGPVILTYGNLSTVPVIERVKDGFFSSKNIVVGHQYFLSIQYGLCLYSGQDIRLKRIWNEEKLIFDGDVGGDETASIDEPNLFGGYSEGGGIVGTFRFHNGNFNQAANSHLLTELDPQTPNYRGLCYIVWEGGNVGESPNLKRYGFEIQNIPQNLGFAPIGDDCNPVEILFDLITNPWGRMGADNSLVDGASFQTAGTILENENHGMSLKIEKNSSADDVIKDILQQIDGILYEDIATGTIKLRLIRDDYTAASLPLFDESNIEQFASFDTRLWQDSYNQVRVNYRSRSDNYKEKPAVAEDAAGIASLGRTKSTTFKFPGCTTAELANRLATRELQFASTPLIQARIITNREGATLAPGDVFRCSWDEYGITEAVFRVMKSDFGDLENGRVALDIVQDKFTTDDSIYADPPDTAHAAPILVPQPVTTQKIFWMNGFMRAGLGYNHENFQDVLSTSFIYLADFPSLGIQTQFIGETKENTSSNFGRDSDDSLFCVRGTLETAIGEREAYISTVGLAIQIENVNGVLKTGGYDQAGGEGLFLIGDPEDPTGYEIIAASSATDNLDGTFTLDGIWRMLFETHVQAWPIGTNIYWIGGIELTSLSDKPKNEAAASYDVRLETKNGTTSLEIEDANIINHAIVPYNAGKATHPKRILILASDVDQANEWTAGDGATTEDTNIGIGWQYHMRHNSVVVSPHSSTAGDGGGGNPSGWPTAASNAYDDMFISCTHTGGTSAPPGFLTDFAGGAATSLYRNIAYWTAFTAADGGEDLNSGSVISMSVGFQFGIPANALNPAFLINKAWQPGHNDYGNRARSVTYIGPTITKQPDP